LVLSQIGFRTSVLEGGYKAWRSGLIQQLPALCESLRLRVLCGPTGSGKTRLLQVLQAQGQQVLDLEALADHRSSVLGRVPGVDQPSQKHFETRIWQALTAMDASRPVYVESESRKVGDVAIPEPLIMRMRAADCTKVHLADPLRVALLLEDYPHLPLQGTWLKQRLQALVNLRGRAQVSKWQQWVDEGQWPVLVGSLLSTHYDPGYERSTQHAFPKSVGSPTVHVGGLSQSDFELAAQQLVAAFDALDSN
jgi:tRNA 2-selenouridine synthase